MSDLNGKRIVMIIASTNFRDEELQVPLEIFKEAQAEVIIASSSLKKAKGMLDGTAQPQMLYSEIDPADYDSVIFVGGSGASEYWDDPKAHAIAKSTLDSGKVLGAICIAPVTLANAGVLSGKKATVWESEKSLLVKGGAVYTGNGVEVDANIVTANGPQSARKFADEIIRLLMP